MDTDSEHETSYTAQYWKSCLKYVENQYFAKRRHLLITTPKSLPSFNLFSSAMASTSSQLSYESYALSSDDKEYLMPKNVAATTPR